MNLIVDRRAGSVRGLARRDLWRASSRHASPVRRKRRGQISGLEERGLPRGQRVLDAASKVRVGGRSLAALEIAWFEIGVRSNPEITTYSIATTSPSRRDRSRQVVLSRMSQIKLTCPLGRSSAFAGWTCADLSCSTLARQERLTERNFDAESQYPYCYGSRPNNRLESTANVLIAADLHVRPVSKTALVSRSWAPRTVKEYTMDDFSQSI
jgi:hypothetical protein